MEKRREKLNTKKQCRFCLSDDESIRSLYDRNRASNTVPLSLKIMSCISVEVFPSDKMPHYICDRCRYFMDISYEFKQICRQADETILQFVQTGTPLEPVTWPPALSKLFHYGSKSSRDVGIKTVVEGGATVEVTSQDVSDSDDDDENVYNVKIEEGSDGGSSACIKVVTSKESQEVTKEKPKQPEKDSERKLGKVSKRRGSGGIADGCWACDECECTYPLQQLLELHKMQKHRTRTVACDMCDAKFFSKSDLTTHQLRHSDDMPFECVACDRRFKRLVLLKRHEMRIHADLPQQKCPDCPASFLSVEELEAHQKKHIIRGEPQYSCRICKKKFYEKAPLQRHLDTVHSDKPQLSCEYCPERFSSVSKLARHVRSHAGERAYPCKYCDKSFIKSHHYTRHLKLKHIESMRAAAFGMPDQYRCEQCEDSFGTQDELIYHSAIHATQNLTCPLCQEKFENVDAVTAHIKSHVNGTEFMCDLCELVFTSKEKLDSHVVIAHDEELRQAQDESSMEMEWKGDEDDDTMNVREEDDQMVVEIKKAEEFMLTSRQEEPEAYAEEKIDNTNSEESEVEATYTELSTVDTLKIVKKEPIASPIKTTVAATFTPTVVKPPAPALATLTTITPKPIAKAEKSICNQTAGILRRAEEIKRKTIQTPPAEITIPDKKEKVIKVETSNSVGASDKSLRLLEKELQELKRTTRNEVTKTPAKPVESLRSNRRPQLHTSTPKLRATEEKKSLATTKSPALEKKLPERRAVKENKEPKEGKSNNTSLKEDKETKVSTNSKEDKEKEIKERDTPKTIVKNGGNDKSVTDDSVRRSTRPSKIKDYAKMIRDRSQMSDDDTDDGDDEEYVDSEKNPEIRSRARRVSVVKPTPTKTVVKPTPTRKRGRPRKDQSTDVPAKLKKDEIEDEEEAKSEKMEAEESSSKGKEKPAADETDESVTADESSNMKAAGGCETKVYGALFNKIQQASDAVSLCVSDASEVAMFVLGSDISKPATADPIQPGIMVSPTGQTLKKVPIKNLPPGVKPLPLPRPISGPGELCEMQIGKKVVKVQKIVMTKAEVEAMAKKGLVEMKDGTMVLKQGIKIPKSDPVAIKSTLVGEAEGVKESPSKKDKGAPSRCDLGDDA